MPRGDGLLGLVRLLHHFIKSPLAHSNAAPRLSGDGFSFYVEVQPLDSIEQLSQCIEQETNALFDVVESRDEYISILGLKDGFFNDLLPNNTVADIFTADDVVFPTLDLLVPLMRRSWKTGPQVTRSIPCPFSR